MDLMRLHVNQIDRLPTTDKTTMDCVKPSVECSIRIQFLHCKDGADSRCDYVHVQNKASQMERTTKVFFQTIKVSSVWLSSAHELQTGN